MVSLWCNGANPKCGVDDFLTVKPINLPDLAPNVIHHAIFFCSRCNKLNFLACYTSSSGEFKTDDLDLVDDINKRTINKTQKELAMELMRTYDAQMLSLKSSRHQLKQ